MWGSHGRLDVERLDVLPVLLQQRDQEVDRQVEVLDDLILGHTDVTDGDVEAEDLLHLELDGGLDVIDLANHVVGVGQHGGELTSLVETGAEKTWDLLDQGLGGEESIVLLGELLDKFLQLLVSIQLGVGQNDIKR